MTRLPPNDESGAAPHPESGAPPACPLLGFFNYPQHRSASPTSLHRCFALDSPGRLPVDTQRTLCLTDRHPTCARYGAAVGTAGVGSDPSV